MKQFLIIIVAISIFSCSEKLERLEDSKRNYDPLDQVECSLYQSDDLFLLNKQNFGSISEKIRTFNDSILGTEWSEKIASAVNDSLVRCVFLIKDKKSNRRLFQLDSTELFNQDYSSPTLSLSGDNIVSNEGDSFTYFTYNGYSVSMTFQMCFDEPIVLKKGRVYDTELNEVKKWHGKYRNSYLVDLKFIIDYRFSPPNSFISSPEREYYRLVINDHCTLLRNQLGDNLNKD